LAVPLQEHSPRGGGLYRSTRGNEIDAVCHRSERDGDIILEVVGSQKYEEVENYEEKSK
jgi:hypothetical protein